MIRYIIENNIVYKINETKGLVKIAFGDVNKIELNCANINTSTPTQIPITYQTFDLEQQQYITDESINKTVDVYVNGELVTTEDIVNGEGIIEFESAEAGVFKIKVENAECEVIVNG